MAHRIKADISLCLKSNSSKKGEGEVLAGVKNTTEPCITDHHQGLPVAIKRLSVKL